MFTRSLFVVAVALAGLPSAAQAEILPAQADFVLKEGEPFFLKFTSDTPSATKIKHNWFSGLGPNGAVAAESSAATGLVFEGDGSRIIGNKSGNTISLSDVNSSNQTLTTKVYTYDIEPADALYPHVRDISRRIEATQTQYTFERSLYQNLAYSYGFKYAVLTSEPKYGTVEISGNGDVTYTAPADRTAAVLDEFEIQLVDEATWRGNKEIFAGPPGKLSIVVDSVVEPKPETPTNPETPEKAACKPMPIPANGARFVFRYSPGSICS
ncbi:hypothetical protein L3V16_22810 [Brucella ciceri]|uniref:hypothetical protein n=1 Tax=Brucella ciceri TaxID=391287 RepID=UPI000DE3E18C|nr:MULTISPECIES: hypothetical protein [Brucella]MCH6206655.1 hypothetical protein [Brucella ciceri]